MPTAALLAAFAGWGVVGAIAGHYPSLGFLAGLAVGAGAMLLGKERRE